MTDGCNKKLTTLLALKGSKFMLHCISCTANMFIQVQRSKDLFNTNVNRFWQTENPIQKKSSFSDIPAKGKG